MIANDNKVIGFWFEFPQPLRKGRPAHGLRLQKPILIMGHIDTVGIERGKWTVSPFGGLVRDGFSTVAARATTEAMGPPALRLLFCCIAKKFHSIAT